MGQDKVSLFTCIRCLDIRAVVYTNRVFETVECVLFIEVSSFQSVLIGDMLLCMTN